jgi:tRNA(Met) C34 N-acetyltransferase TmcA
VEGGGLAVLLLSRLSSLTQLYTLAMDVHGRLRTEAHQEVTGACVGGGVDGFSLKRGVMGLDLGALGGSG